MTQKLQDVQAAAGAIFESTVPLSFGNDLQALPAAQSGVALYDRSDWGRIEVSDQERLAFLHNQSTNDFKRLQPGQGCETVFVTSTARTIDLATAYVTQEAVILLVSPSRRQQLLQWLDRYIFFGNQVKLTDISDRTCCFSLIGPASSSLLQTFGVPNLEAPAGSHSLVEIAGIPVRVAVGSGLPNPGYTLIAEATSAAQLWQHLFQAGAVPLGETTWEQLRIEQGRPKPDHELTEDYNPLEAGLWQTISFDKGCYIGQETIARLNTYQGVKQQLWGIKLAAAAEPGTPLTAEDKKVGVLTSVVQTNNGSVGLAYARTKAGGPGLKVAVGDTEGELVAVPFLTHSQG